MGTRGGRYCSFINCSTNTKTSIDSRTNKKLKFYSYPLKDTERCKKWIISSRRENVSLESVAKLLVCALHFERTQFNCPTDIANSRLLPAAVPTLVDCPNPSKTFEGKRKPPKCREYLSPKRKRLCKVPSRRKKSCLGRHTPGARRYRPKKKLQDCRCQNELQVSNVEVGLATATQELKASIQKEIISMKIASDHPYARPMTAPHGTKDNAERLVSHDKELLTQNDFSDLLSLAIKMETAKNSGETHKDLVKDEMNSVLQTYTQAYQSSAKDLSISDVKQEIIDGDSCGVGDQCHPLQSTLTNDRFSALTNFSGCQDLFAVFNCSFCMKFFTSEKILQNHKISVHLREMQALASRALDERKDRVYLDLHKRFMCCICNKTFRTGDFFYIHAAVQHKEVKLLTCASCKSIISREK